MEEVKGKKDLLQIDLECQLQNLCDDIDNRRNAPRVFYKKPKYFGLPMDLG